MAKRKKSHKDKQLTPSELIAAIDGITKVLVTLFRYGGYVLIAMFIGEAIEPLAGEFTSANFDLNADLSTNSSLFCPTTYVLVLMMVITFLGLRTGLRERKLRHRNTEELSRRIQYLESMVDPDRTSSKLTTYGETREEDK